MMEHDIVACLHELLLTVVPCTLTGERDLVLRLTEMHMSHGPYRVCRLVEVSRVARQRGSPVPEVYMSLDDLRVGIRPVHVELQFIGMYEIDSVIHRLAFAWCCKGGQHTKCKEA